MVDKYAVKEYVAKLIGEEYIIPTLGVWDKFDDIDILMELDKRSNDTIIGIEKLLRKEEQSGLVDFNYTNIFLNGLISLKNLNNDLQNRFF